MSSTENNSRYTTLEVARRLRLGGPATVQLLRAARTPFVWCGRAYLWDAAHVDDLVLKLNLERPETRG